MALRRWRRIFDRPRNWSNSLSLNRCFRHFGDHRALLKIREADLLPQIFTTVIIPEAVKRELLAEHSSIPGWLEVRGVQNISETEAYTKFLGAGESEAIALAKELKPDRILMDERKGRRFAKQAGLNVIGLLGVVILARQLGMIANARMILERLETEGGMHMDDEVRNAALGRIGE